MALINGLNYSCTDHYSGSASLAVLKESRDRLAGALKSPGDPQKEFTFTSGGTEVAHL